MIKTYIRMVFLTIAVVLVGCNKDSDSNTFKSFKTPEQVVKEYARLSLEKMPLMKSEALYQLLSSEDQQAMSLSEYLKRDLDLDSQVVAKLNAYLPSRSRYTIRSEKVEDSKARFTVQYVSPNFYEIYLKLKPEYLDRIDEMLMGLPESTLTSEINLVKEQNGWKIYRDFKSQLAQEKLIAEAEDLLGGVEMMDTIEGRELVKIKSEMLAAKEKYLQALAIKESYRVDTAMEYLNEQLLVLASYEAYKNEIVFQNIEVGMATSGDLGIFGELKNNSDVTLSKVTTVAYLLDAEGNPIHEIEYYPLWHTEGSLRGDAPLKPGYIKKFGYKALDAPSDWSKKIRLEVTDVRVLPGS